MVYPHGVERSDAQDLVSGSAKKQPVTNFVRNDALYQANRKSDGVACEKPQD